MRKSIYYFGGSLLVVVFLMVVGWPPRDTSGATEVLGNYGKSKKESMERAEEEEEGMPLRDRMDLAMAQEFKKTVDPALGRVPKERLLLAKAYADELRSSNKVNAAIPGVVWKERGPSNVSGRTRAILVDPNTGSGLKVFAGGVAGGLWVTNDISANPPVWTAINDLMTNLAVSSIASDPTNPLVMYAGTGEGYFNLDAMSGAGIFKSVNGGNTWTQLAATNNGNFFFVFRIAVNATGVILAATSSGLRRSADGGTTWTKVLGTGLGITGAVSNRCYDVEVAANGDIYASLDGSVHKSTNAGVTFGPAQTLPIAVGRVELACAPNDLNYVYAVCENGNVVAGFLRTTNGGTTWTSRTEPADADPGVGATDMSRGQAWYDLSIAVDPLNRDRLFTGGVDLFVSGDGAGTWTQVAHWYGGFGFQYVHADQHIVIFQPGSSSVAYFGNDGGIYRTTNANAVSPAITFKGDNYNVTQFYACAIHPTALTDYYLAGAQDNGSQQFSSAGINSTIEVTGGDGAFCHIDQDQPQFQFTAYVQNDFYRSTNGGASFTNVTTSGGQFISPTDYDDVNNRMYMCDGNNNYRRWDNPQSGATFVQVPVAAFGSDVSCVTVSPNTANRVFFGISNGRVFRVDNAHTGAPTATNISTGLPGGNPSCVEVQTGNDNHLLVVYSNYGLNSVWESVNGGTSWTSVEGNLPDMPIRWALFNPNNSAQAMVATELGVWTTDLLNGGTTNWGPSNTGFANTRIDMLQLRQSDKFVIAASHGRGLYSTDIFTTPTALFTGAPTVQYIGRPVQFTDQSYRATSWAWNFGDGGTSTSQNPSYSYANAGLYNVTLTINAGASTITKNGFIQILPDLGTPYAPAAGGNFEAPNQLHFGPINVTGTDWERGNSAVAGKSGFTSASNSWVTGLVGNYVDNTRAELYCPSYNFSSGGVYTLRFQTKFATETGFDGFRVESSTNKGVSWSPVGTAVAAGWYNNANNSGAGVFPANQAWFSGSQAAFGLKSFDVSALAGNPSVAFRFVFGTDPGVITAGVAIDDFEILGPGNPSGLPLTGSPLYGAWTGAQPNLSWSTFSQINTRGFGVERSDDGQQFAEVGYLNGAGTNNETLKYLWEDAGAVSDHYFYRLRRDDLDGNFLFSNTVELSRGQGMVGIAKVYPNPFADALSVELSSPGNGKADLVLYDLSGRKVREVLGASTAGNVIALNGLDLPAGTYMLRVTVGNATTTRKVVRQ
ncbi:MAG: T9SS type A sorting domain-containing protein [Bacteroidetes bacterium]|nr:T9SS type A sorting domain-containing protein [Bacteroidota bacterium]